MALRDVTVQRPRILFVGINPGLRSDRLGHHFAGRGNPFWRLLYAARIVPIELTYEEDDRLAEFGIALTNLCPRATRSAAELTSAEMRRGRATVLRKVRKMHPQVVAFVGVSIYRSFFPAGKGGAGRKPEQIAGAPVFVLPNPSGLNAAYPGFRHKLVWFKRLRAFAAAANEAT